MKKKINWGLERLGPKYYGRLKDLSEKEILYKDRANSISLVADFDEINPGERSYIFVLSSPEGSIIPGFVWESSDPNIANVDSNGMLYAKSEGDVVITATPVDSDFEAITISIHIGKVSPTPVQGNNEIWYTTHSGEILDKDFSDTQYFGENLTLSSHTYEDDLGKAVFSGGNVTMCFIQGDDLANVYLPETCNQIYMVAGNENLEGIYIRSKVAHSAVDSDGQPIIPVFGDGEHKEFKIYVPSDCLALYKAAWTDYTDQIEALPE